jgi:hypothetical protein
MNPLSSLAAVLLGAATLHAQIPPAVPIELTSANAPPWASDLYSWTGDWQAPQALYDRGAHQDDPSAWSQEGDNEGSTWSNPLPGQSYGVLVVDLGELRSINHFAVFQMMASDGKTTAVSVFRNSTFTGDLAPTSSGKGWKPVVTESPIAEGVLDSGVVSSPTAIDVASFDTRYLMIHIFNDGTLGAGDYIELKGIKAFLDDSINVLRSGPSFIVAVDPPEAGSSDPAPGRYEFVPGEPGDISLLADADATFLGWELAGSGEVEDSGLTATTLTLGDNGGRLTARLNLDRITRGSVRTVTTLEAGLGGGSFTSKPRITATFIDPFTGKTRRANARVLTKATPQALADGITFEWRKRVRLYDPKALKAMEDIGLSAVHYVAAWQNQLALHLSISGKDVPDGVQPLALRGLGAPTISETEEIEVDGQPALTLIGESFGTKLPKVWREYTVNLAPGLDVTRRQLMTVVKPTSGNSDWLDSKGKPTFMDGTTGESALTVLVPAEPEDGMLTGVIVLDNGVGLGTVQL